MHGLKITILNGSPKGMTSVTMQYLKYLEKRFPEHSFNFISVAQKFSKYEKNEDALIKDLNQVAESDLVIWAYPLYFLTVCSQYKRFIELIFERNLENYFSGKYTAILSTSIHFFDSTALDYIHGICDDLEMNFIDSITASMNDLGNKTFRKNLDHAFLEWIAAVNNKAAYTKYFAPIKYSNFNYEPETKSMEVIKTETETKVCIVGDLETEDSNIRKMAKTAEKAFKQSGAYTEIVDLRSFKYGPCTGCMRCGFDNICAYTGKDQFIDIHRNKVLSADIIVFAGQIHDRYLSFLWQRFLDRSFNRTHIPTLTGKQITFLISGPFAQCDNLKTTLRGYTETNGGSLTAFISDDIEDSEKITKAIFSLPEKMINRAENNYIQPKGFLGEAGHKVFRDDIFSHLKFVFQEDHKYYKKNGLYDFPHKKRMMRFMSSFMVLLTKFPGIRKKINGGLREGMLVQFTKSLEKVKPYNGNY
ncbi:MAG: NAD(P)H-dependent oxidoreductase [Spirochaetales bacterium]|nr:NAD(P)H-dependent oxidoreductase [Spirochaetales bacterium]